jgi:phosphate transport system protein
MPRLLFDRELSRLQDEILALGSMVSHALRASVIALRDRDAVTAQTLIQGDIEINRKRFDIEGECLRLIATQQPMAKDARLLASVLEITTELERIGDYAKGIGKIILLIGPEPLMKPLVDIPLMCEQVLGMLGRALDAFIRQDADAARAIAAEDDKVDDLYNKVYREIIGFLMEKPQLFDRANYLLWAAHNLERAGDRTVNICERVIFNVTGQMAELDVT